MRQIERKEVRFLLDPADAESARGVSPRAAHRSGLDTLASSGSCHRTKAAASRRELELLLLPVGSLPTSVTCSLRSTGITPLALSRQLYRARIESQGSPRVMPLRRHVATLR